MHLIMRPQVSNIIRGRQQGLAAIEVANIWFACLLGEAVHSYAVRYRKFRKDALILVTMMRCSGSTLVRAMPLATNAVPQ
jgi:hypothetical protein